MKLTKLFYLSYFTIFIIGITLFYNYRKYDLNSVQQEILLSYITTVSVFLLFAYFASFYYRQYSYLYDPVELFLLIILIYYVIKFNYNKYSEYYQKLKYNLYQQFNSQ